MTRRPLIAHVMSRPPEALLRLRDAEHTNG